MDNQQNANANNRQRGQIVSKPGAAIEIREIPISPSVQRQITRSLQLGKAAADQQRKVG